jgi:hypothetical protein
VEYLGERVWVTLMLMTSALPPIVALRTRPYVSIAERWKTKGLSLDACIITKIVDNMTGNGGRPYVTRDYHLPPYKYRIS